jgi:hypothetical protein
MNKAFYAVLISKDIFKKEIMQHRIDTNTGESLTKIQKKIIKKVKPIQKVNFVLYCFANRQ